MRFAPSPIQLMRRVMPSSQVRPFNEQTRIRRENFENAIFFTDVYWRADGGCVGVWGARCCGCVDIIKTSGDLVSKPAGSPFEITFSVRLDSNTTRIYNSNGQQVDEYGNEIDSSGYLIHYIGGQARRLISSDNLSDANTTDSDDNATNPLSTAYAQTAVPDVQDS